MAGLIDRRSAQTHRCLEAQIRAVLTRGGFRALHHAVDQRGLPGHEPCRHDHVGDATDQPAGCRKALHRQHTHDGRRHVRAATEIHREEEPQALHLHPLLGPRRERLERERKLAERSRVVAGVGSRARRETDELAERLSLGARLLPSRAQSSAGRHVPGGIGRTGGLEEPGDRPVEVLGLLEMLGHDERVGARLVRQPFRSRSVRRAPVFRAEHAVGGVPQEAMAEGDHPTALTLEPEELPADQMVHPPRGVLVAAEGFEGRSPEALPEDAGEVCHPPGFRLERHQPPFQHREHRLGEAVVPIGGVANELLQIEGVAVGTFDDVGHRGVRELHDGADQPRSSLLAEPGERHALHVTR